MQCPECEIDVGEGQQVFMRVRQGAEEWVCSMACSNKREAQGELWSVWRPGVVVEDVVDLFGSIVTKVGLRVGKVTTIGMSVILPLEASLDRIGQFAGTEVKLSLCNSTVRPVEEVSGPIDELDDLGIDLDKLGLEELDDLRTAGILTIQGVVDFKTAEALQKHTGLSKSRARSVMKRCKTALK